MEETEVLVLGGGPAGSAAAIVCAQAGLHVTLLERSVFPRHRPGETLHPGIETPLRALGIWDSFLACDPLRHEGHWIRQGAITRFERFGGDSDGPWHGFQIWRADFDALLLQQAVQKGVRLLQPCRPQRLLCAGGRVIGVESTAGEWQTRFVVDATGSSRWTARQLDLAVATRSPKLTVRYGYLRGECCPRDAAPLWVAEEGGWTWTARVRPSLYQWTRLWFTHDKARRTPMSWVPEEFRGLQPEGRTIGVDATWRFVEQPAGPGYFLAGDAGAILDPASSHGVLKAILSGSMAAHAIVRIHRQEMSEPAAACAYTLWLQRWFASDAARLNSVYTTLRADTSADSALRHG